MNSFFFVINHTIYYSSKFWRMIHLFQMRKFMTDHIVHRKLWHFYQSSIESNILVSRASSSSSFSISDDDFIQRKSIFFLLELESSCGEILFSISFVPLELGIALQEIRAGSDYFILIIQEWFFGMFRTFIKSPKVPMQEDFIRSYSRSSNNIPS